MGMIYLKNRTESFYYKISKNEVTEIDCTDIEFGVAEIHTMPINEIRIKYESNTVNITKKEFEKMMAYARSLNN